MAQLRNGNEVVAPTKADAALARKSSQKIAAHLDKTGRLRVQIHTGTEKNDVILPRSVVRVLIRLLNEMAQGNAVTLTPIKAELTTQQAADVLNVSRPHLVKLLDEGTIPSRKVGSHRRVQPEDLLAYKRDFHARRQESLKELVALGQDLDLGY
jgi:excisionase family DNA binding protein